MFYRVRLLMLLAGFVFLLYGCMADIKGGGSSHTDTAKDDRTDVRIVVEPKGYVSFWASSKLVASTQMSSTSQPSVRAPADMIKSLGISGTDEVGGIDFKGMARKNQNWMLAVVLGAVGAFLLWRRKIISGAVCVAGAVLTILYPEALIIIAIGTLTAVAVSLFITAKQRDQVIAGIQKGKELTGLSPVQTAIFNTAMASEQDAGTQKAVRRVKAELKLDSSPIVPVLPSTETVSNSNSTSTVTTAVPGVSATASVIPSSQATTVVKDESSFSQ